MPAGSISVTRGGAVVSPGRPGYPAATMRLPKRLASPAGFALALLLFLLLPVTAVSCDEPGVGSFDVSYTGLDLAADGEPAVTIVDEARSVDESDTAEQPPPEPGAQWLAIVTAVLMLTGLATVAPRAPRIRLLAAAGVAGLAAALLVTTELVAQANLRSDLHQRAGDTDFPLDDLVEARPGFWLALLVLMLVSLVNGAIAVRQWMRQ